MTVNEFDSWVAGSTQAIGNYVGDMNVITFAVAVFGLGIVFIFAQALWENF